MNTCRFIVLCVVVAVSATENWTGPLADHKLGQLVEDTPEVAAAKRQHALAFTQIQSLLPEYLSEDPEGYPTVHHNHIHHIPAVTPQDTVNHIHHFSVVTPQDPAAQVPWKGPFADHQLGQQVHETPEVAAARKHHEDVYSKVRSILPELPREEGDEDPRVVPQVFPTNQRLGSQVLHQANINDLEAAREAHAKAVMDRIALLRSLHSNVQLTTPIPVVRSLQQSTVDNSEFVAARQHHAKAIAAVLGY